MRGGGTGSSPAKPFGFRAAPGHAGQRPPPAQPLAMPLPAMGFRHMANALGQERDLYAWFHRMLSRSRLVRRK